VADEDSRGRCGDGTTGAAFVALVFLAGGNAVAIRYTSCAACDLDPFWAAATRFALASLAFLGIAAALGVRLPRGRALLGAGLYGALQFGGGFGLAYWGLLHVPAGLGQVLLACVPLLTFFLALAQRQEVYRWDRLVGAVVALAGIGIVFASGFDRGVPLPSMAAILAGAALWAEALVVVKGFPPVHPAALNAVGMAVGAGILLLLTFVTGEDHDVPSSGRTWTAQAYLVIAGSIGVFWLYVVVLRRWTASAASYQMVLIPLVTVALAWWLQDEQLTWSFAVGSAAVLVGVYLGALRPTRAAAGRGAPRSP
jgi:drug/metabolite transporter (DMT)-like permease